MKGIFTFTVNPDGITTRDRIKSLLNNRDFENYILAMKGQKVVLQAKSMARMGEKEFLYAYYHGPLLDIAMQALSAAGYEMMDKLKADYILKQQCAESTMIKDGEEVLYLEDKSAMNKTRLKKYVEDCIFFLESDLGVQNIPDPEAYKNKEQTGHSFKSVKYGNNNNQ